MAAIDHIVCQTYHGRKGKISNAFRYSVDYILLNPEIELKMPRLFSRNTRGLMVLDDTDHGGAPKSGSGTIWVRKVLEDNKVCGVENIELLAQPKMFGHVFNPVSFWLCWRKDNALIAVIAEVTNTFGDRHSYLVSHTDYRSIGPDDRMHAKKILYVSPFQPVEGDYEFRFDINEDRIGIWIDYSQGDGGLVATLTGKRRALNNRSILAAALRRPFGSRRVLALIHWQALKLWLKKAAYRSRPLPPSEEVSR